MATPWVILNLVVHEELAAAAAAPNFTLAVASFVGMFLDNPSCTQLVVVRHFRTADGLASASASAEHIGVDPFPILLNIGGVGLIRCGGGREAAT
ncbi:unnamed protein product [Urochloa humidicola]